MIPNENFFPSCSNILVIDFGYTEYSNNPLDEIFNFYTYTNE